MIIQTHNIPNAVFLIQSASGIGQDHGLDAENFANARGEGDGFHGVAFIEAVKKVAIIGRSLGGGGIGG